MDEFDSVANVAFCGVVATVAFGLAYLARSHVARALLLGFGSVSMIVVVVWTVMAFRP